MNSMEKDGAEVCRLYESRAKVTVRISIFN